MHQAGVLIPQNKKLTRHTANQHSSIFNPKSKVVGDEGFEPPTLSV
jgi:hypothetical protein